MSKDYFDKEVIFNPRNLDTDFLQEEMDFYYQIYEWFAHSAIMEDNKASEKLAIKAYAISETLKAVLCLCADRTVKNHPEKTNPEIFNYILDSMCPIKRTEKISLYEFKA